MIIATSEPRLCITPGTEISATARPAALHPAVHGDLGDGESGGAFAFPRRCGRGAAGADETLKWIASSVRVVAVPLRRRSGGGRGRSRRRIAGGRGGLGPRIRLRSRRRR